jgi:sugar/nucleoside kinase (ribokinase family)
MRIPIDIPGPAGRAVDVVGIGENSIDYVGVLAPEVPRSSKGRLGAFSVEPGGQIATALVACARLGWRARYVGVFGDDEAGRRSRESLVREQVDVSAAGIVRGASNRVAIVLVDQAGERTVLAYRDEGAAVNVTAATEAAVSGRILLVDCEDPPAATAGAIAARQASIPTMVDVDEVTPESRALLSHIDVIVTAEDVPRALTGRGDLGEALLAIEREFHASLVVVTLGARGSLARCGGREFQSPAPSVAVVDATGAGDVFRGALAAAFLTWPAGDVETALAYANCAAALSCRGVGARGALPAQEEIRRWLGR